MAKPTYSRVLLKMSGEALAEDSLGIQEEAVTSLGEEVAEAAGSGIQVAIAIGGGNIWRGAEHASVERTTSDTMGMLAHVINALALQSAVEKAGQHARVQTALSMPEVAEPYIRRRAIRHLEKGRVVIFAAGTGNPYFTTDTAAALRSLEIGADVLLKGTKVDGIYDSDPAKNPKAKRHHSITYDDAIAQRLNVMDATAFTLCRENNMPIIVFNLLKVHSLKRVLNGETIGTEVHA